MASKQTQKGSRFEYAIRDLLTEKCGVKWERVPMSGAGTLKGDLYCPTKPYHYCFECKSYKESNITENLLHAKSNLIYSWWYQCVREAEAMNRTPALVFKKDRGKPLIAVTEYIPELNYIQVSTNIDNKVNIYIYIFTEWLEYKKPEDLVT